MKGILRTAIETGNFNHLDDPEWREANLKPQPPDMETLEDWMNDGGCEAACIHECWVEPDGYCQHGKPSWLIEMGLI